VPTDRNRGANPVACGVNDDIAAHRDFKRVHAAAFEMFRRGGAERIGHGDKRLARTQRGLVQDQLEPERSVVKQQVIQWLLVAQFHGVVAVVEGDVMFLAPDDVPLNSSVIEREAKGMAAVEWRPTPIK